MIEFKIKNTYCSLSFSFFALFAVLFYTNVSVKILLALLACIVHEAGHIIVMSLYKCYPQRIIFYGGGIKIVPNCRIISKEKEIFVLLAGSLSNIILTVLLSGTAFRTFAAANFAIGLFNLLPFKAFDGGQILKQFFDDFESEKKQRLYNLSVKLLCLFIVALGIFAIIQYKMNVSLAVTICYIIVSELFC